MSLLSQAFSGRPRHAGLQRQKLRSQQRSQPSRPNHLTQMYYRFRGRLALTIPDLVSLVRSEMGAHVRIATFVCAQRMLRSHQRQPQRPQMSQSPRIQLRRPAAIQGDLPQPLVLASAIQATHEQGIKLQKLCQRCLCIAPSSVSVALAPVESRRSLLSLPSLQHLLGLQNLPSLQLQRPNLHRLVCSHLICHVTGTCGSLAENAASNLSLLMASLVTLA